MMYMADSFYVPAQSNASVSTSTKPSSDTGKPASSSDFQQLLTEKAQDTTQDANLLEQVPTTPSQPGSESDSETDPKSLAQDLAALLLMQPVTLASMQTQVISTPPVQQQVLASATSVAPMPAPTLGKTVAPAAPLIPQSVPEIAATPVPPQAAQATVTASTVLPVPPPQVSQAQPQLQVQPQNQGQLPVQGQMQVQAQAQASAQGQNAPIAAVSAPQHTAPQSTQVADAATTTTPVVTAPSTTAEQDKPELLLQNEASRKPLFQDTKNLPVKVGDTQTLDTQSSDFDQQLGKQVSDALKQGEQKLSLRLAPKELGTIVVEMTRGQDGSLQVMLRASTAAATTLLTDRSAELSGLLRASTQAPVFVEVQQSSNAQQQQQQDQQQGNAHHNQQQHQQQQQQTHKQTQDFLDQLRLGLLPFDSEVS